MDRIIGWVVAFKLWVARRIRPEFRTAESFEKMPRLGWRWPRYYLLWGPLCALPFVALAAVMFWQGYFHRGWHLGYWLGPLIFASYWLAVYYGACMYGRSRGHYLRCLFYHEQKALVEPKERKQMLALDGLSAGSLSGLGYVLFVLIALAMFLIRRSFRRNRLPLELVMVMVAILALAMFLRALYYRRIARTVPEDSPLRQLAEEAHQLYPRYAWGKSKQILENSEKD